MILWSSPGRAVVVQAVVVQAVVVQAVVVQAVVQAVIQGVMQALVQGVVQAVVQGVPSHSEIELLNSQNDSTVVCLCTVPMPFYNLRSTFS